MGTINDKFRIVWIVTLVGCSVVVLMGLYLMYRSTKIYQRNFFVLMSLLFLIGAVSAGLTLTYELEITKTLSELPILEDKDLDCFPPISSQTDTCITLIDTINSDVTWAEHFYILAFWFFSLFELSFSSAHVVFSTKYWTLSLKLESLINRQVQISSR